MSGFNMAGQEKKRKKPPQCYFVRPMVSRTACVKVHIYLWTYLCIYKQVIGEAFEGVSKEFNPLPI